MGDGFDSHRFDKNDARVEQEGAQYKHTIEWNDANV